MYLYLMTINLNQAIYIFFQITFPNKTTHTMVSFD